MNYANQSEVTRIRYAVERVEQTTSSIIRDCREFNQALRREMNDVLHRCAMVECATAGINLTLEVVERLDVLARKMDALNRRLDALEKSAVVLAPPVT